MSTIAVLMAAFPFGGSVNVSIATGDQSSEGSGTQAINITARTDGDLTSDADLGGFATADWATPRYATVGNQYEVRMTVNSGSSPGIGTTGVWLALSSNRAWQWSTSAFVTANVTLEIRRTGGSVLASDTFNVSVTGGLP